MKRTIIYSIVIAIFVLSCQSEEIDNLTVSTCEDNLREYFDDSLAYRIFRTDKFLAHLPKNCSNFKMYPPENYNDTIYYPYFYMLLYAFEEDFIDFDNINATDEYYRFTVKPCFRKPYYIKIEKKNNKTYYTAKLTDGDGGYFTGTLTTSITKVFSDSLIDNVSKKFENIDFWELSDDNKCRGGFDGETWFIEAVKDGEYNLINRWVPVDCGDSITKTIGSIGIDLRELGKIKIENLEINNDY
jgi:hypothetical protein